jgi:hypothetical protein
MDMKRHLSDRGVDLSLYSSIYISDDPARACFLLYNLSGQVDGMHKYNPFGTKKKNVDDGTAKYVTFTTAGKGRMPVFGIDLIDANRQNLIVTEGVLKSANLHRLGYNSIAVLTSDPKYLRSLLFILSYQYNLFAVGDDDKGGQQLVKTVGRGFCSPKDIDEMDDQLVHDLIGQFVGQ